MAQDSTVCLNVEPDGCSSVATPVSPAPARVRVGKGDADGAKASRSMTCEFLQYRFGSHPARLLVHCWREQPCVMILHCQMRMAASGLMSAVSRVNTMVAQRLKSLDTDGNGK
jgi:hypothetical protein